ncbi:MAG: glycosyltransferase family 39 protein [Thermoanaerobaculia bacterium]|nr:glycosyltransferase family 39 protein [Thermoanaerobaculia bacterium]
MRALPGSALTPAASGVAGPPRGALLPALAAIALALPLFTIGLSRDGLRGDEGIYGLVVGDRLEIEDPKGLTIPAAEYVNKPPLALWTMAASARLLGLDEASLRLPSALWSIVATGALVALCHRAASVRASLLAGALLATAPGFLFLHGGRSATMESWQLALWTMGMVAICGASPRYRIRRVALVVAFAAVFLSKGLAGGLLLALSGTLAGWSPRGSSNESGTPLPLPPGAVLASALLGLVPLLAWWSLRFESMDRAGDFLFRDGFVRFTQGIRSPVAELTALDRFEPWLRDFGPALLLAAVALLPAPPAEARDSRRALRRAALATLVGVSLYQWTTAQPRPWYPYLSYPALGLLCALGFDRLTEIRVAGRRTVGIGLAVTLLTGTALLRLDAGRRLAEGAHRESLADWIATARAVPGGEVLADPDLALPGQRPREWNRFYLAALPASAWRLPEPGEDRCVLLVTGNQTLAAKLARDLASNPLALALQAARERPLWGLDLCAGRVRSALAQRATPGALEGNR